MKKPGDDWPPDTRPDKNIPEDTPINPEITPAGISPIRPKLPEGAKAIFNPVELSTQILKGKVVLSFNRSIKDIALSANDALTLATHLREYGKALNRKGDDNGHKELS